MTQARVAKEPELRELRDMLLVVVLKSAIYEAVSTEDAVGNFNVFVWHLDAGYFEKNSVRVVWKAALKRIGDESGTKGRQMRQYATWKFLISQEL